MTNLAPFGTCRSLGFPATASATAAAQGVLTPMPCLHNTPFPWMGGKMDYMVQGQPALLKSSKCQCLWGGTISLITDGQIPTGPADLTRKPKTPFNVPTLNLARHQEPAASSETNISPTQGSLYQDSEPPTSSIDSLISKQKQIDIIKAANKGKKGDEINSNSIFSNANLHQNTLLLLKSSEYDPKKKYRVNCSTTSNTFMLRMLGYQVTAKGRGPLSTELLAENPFSLWTNDNQSHVKFFNDGDLLNNWNDNSKYKVFCQSNNLIETDIESRKKYKAQLYKQFLQDACKEEGYYIINLSWADKQLIPEKDSEGNVMKDENGLIIYKKNQNGNYILSNTRHTTIIKSTKDENGNIVLEYIEPQDPSEKKDIDSFLERLAPPDEQPPKEFTFENGRYGAGNGVMRVLDKNANLVDGLQLNEDLLYAFELYYGGT